MEDKPEQEFVLCKFIILILKDVLFASRPLHFSCPPFFAHLRDQAMWMMPANSNGFSDEDSAISAHGLRAQNRSLLIFGLVGWATTDHLMSTSLRHAAHKTDDKQCSLACLALV